MEHLAKSNLPAAISHSSRSWKNPYLARVHKQDTSTYSKVVDMQEHRYRVVPRVEETLVGFLSLKHFLPLLRGYHMLVQMDYTSVVSYIKSPGRFAFAAHFQAGTADSALDRREIQVTMSSLHSRACKLGGRYPFEAGAEAREWRLHPQVVESIRRRYSRAEVYLFASEEMTHYPLWFGLTPPAPLGLDAIEQTFSSDSSAPEGSSKGSPGPSPPSPSEICKLWVWPLRGPSS